MTHLTDAITLAIVLIAITISAGMGKLALIRSKEIANDLQ